MGSNYEIDGVPNDFYITPSYPHLRPAFLGGPYASKPTNKGTAINRIIGMTSGNFAQMDYDGLINRYKTDFNITDNDVARAHARLVKQRERENEGGSKHKTKKYKCYKHTKTGKSRKAHKTRKSRKSHKSHKARKSHKSRK